MIRIRAMNAAGRYYVMLAPQDLPWLRRFELGYGIFFCSILCSFIIAAVAGSIEKSGDHSSSGGFLITVLYLLILAGMVLWLVLINLHGTMTSLTRQRVVILTIALAALFVAYMLIVFMAMVAGKNASSAIFVLQAGTIAVSVYVLGLLLLRVGELIGQAKAGRSLYNISLILVVCWLVMAILGTFSSMAGLLMVGVIVELLVFAVFMLRLWVPLREALVRNQVRPFVPHGWMYAAAISAYALLGIFAHSFYS